MTGDGHKNQDISTQMTLKREGLEKLTSGFGIGEEAEKSHGPLSGAGAGAYGRLECRKWFFKKQGACGPSLRIFRGL